MFKRTFLIQLVSLAIAAPARSQIFTKPVRLIVPYPPGGSADGPARLLAAQLSKLAGQSVIVENRGGAGGSIGAAEVARSQPDGHTLLLSSSALSVASALSKNSQVDALKDFRHAAMFATVPIVVVAHPQRFSFANWQEFIAASKAAPSKYAFASAGNASPAHLGAALLEQAFGVQWLHVPYKGTGPALQDLLGGQVDFSVVGLSSALPHIRAGKLKALAVTQSTRLEQLPQVPAVAEMVPGFDFSMWFGLAAPAGTATATVTHIERLAQAALAEPDFQKRLAEAGVLPSYQGGGATTKKVALELAEFSALGRRNGISLD